MHCSPICTVRSSNEHSTHRIIVSYSTPAKAMSAPMTHCYESSFQYLNHFFNELPDFIHPDSTDQSYAATLCEEQMTVHLLTVCPKLLDFLKSS